MSFLCNRQLHLHSVISSFRYFQQSVVPIKVLCGLISIQLCVYIGEKHSTRQEFTNRHQKYPFTIRITCEFENIPYFRKFPFYGNVNWHHPPVHTRSHGAWWWILEKRYHKKRSLLFLVAVNHEPFFQGNLKFKMQFLNLMNKIWFAQHPHVMHHLNVKSIELNTQTTRHKSGPQFHPVFPFASVKFPLDAFVFGPTDFASCAVQKFKTVREYTAFFIILVTEVSKTRVGHLRCIRCPE